MGWGVDYLVSPGQSGLPNYIGVVFVDLSTGGLSKRISAAQSHDPGTYRAFENWPVRLGYGSYTWQSDTTSKDYPNCGKSDAWNNELLEAVCCFSFNPQHVLRFLLLTIV